MPGIIFFPCAEDHPLFRLESNEIKNVTNVTDIHSLRAKNDTMLKLWSERRRYYFNYKSIKCQVTSLAPTCAPEGHMQHPCASFDV